MYTGIEECGGSGNLLPSDLLLHVVVRKLTDILQYLTICSFSDNCIPIKMYVSFEPAKLKSGYNDTILFLYFFSIFTVL